MWPQPLQVAEVSKEGLEARLQGGRRAPFARLAREIQYDHFRPGYQVELVMPALKADDTRECGFSGRLAGAMPRLQDTAYPRLKSVMTARDLSAVFTPSSDEILVARRTARGAAAQLGFLVLLKLYQRLGRAMALAEAPQSIVEHVARAAGVPAASLVVESYDRSG